MDTLKKVIELREEVFSEMEDPQGKDDKFHDYVESHAYEIAEEAKKLLDKYRGIKIKLEKVQQVLKAVY